MPPQSLHGHRRPRLHRVGILLSFKTENKAKMYLLITNHILSLFTIYKARDKMKKDTDLRWKKDKKYLKILAGCSSLNLKQLLAASITPPASVYLFVLPLSSSFGLFPIPLITAAWFLICLHYWYCQNGSRSFASLLGYDAVPYRCLHSVPYFSALAYLFLSQIQGLGNILVAIQFQVCRSSNIKFTAHKFWDLSIILIDVSKKTYACISKVIQVLIVFIIKHHFLEELPQPLN